MSESQETQTVSHTNWAKTNNSLLKDIAAISPTKYPIEGEKILSIVVDDAINGIDIIVEYPDFYQRMLANKSLRQAFIEALEILAPSDFLEAGC